MDEVTQIKERLDIAEVLGTYIQLKQSGRNLKAVCPFHNEKTPSLMVSPEKGIWHCFGCEEGGDVIKFVMKIEGLDFPEALEMLAKKAGVELKPRRVSQAAAKEKDRLFEMCELAVQYYQASLIKNVPAQRYLINDRGITKETLKQFRIGYAPNDWNALTGFLAKRGYANAEMLKAGLAAQKAGRTSVYDLFRGRAMFPILDHQGRAVGFSARMLGAGEGAKYINTPSTPIYDKSRILYGFFQAKEAIRKSDEVVFVEGNMDVIASHQAGVSQVVASSGTALTLDQLKSISKLSKNVKLAFDTDAAGLAATQRAIDLCQQLGLTLKVVAIEAKDPDELIKKDVRAWRGAIAGAAYVIDYLLNYYSQTLDITSSLGKKQYTNLVLPSIKRLSDPVEQDHYLQQIAAQTGSTMESLRQKLKESKDAPLPQSARVVARPEPTVLKHKTADELIEESLLAINLAYPESRLSLDDMSESDFESDERKQIFNCIRDNSDIDALGVAKTLPSLEDYVKILILKGEEEFGDLPPADRSFEAFTLAKRLLSLSLQKSRHILANQIREAENKGDAALARKLREEFQKVLKEEV